MEPAKIALVVDRQPFQKVCLEGTEGWKVRLPGTVGGGAGGSSFPLPVLLCTEVHICPGTVPTSQVTTGPGKRQGTEVQREQTTC